MIPSIRTLLSETIAVTAAVTAATVLTACGSSGRAAGPADGGPRVVAASAWEAAFARAAGARDVSVIVPPGITHPPDYDPKPSDIAKIAGADFVLYASFEGFAAKLKSAAGSAKARLIELHLDNGPATVTKEVTRLGGAFGTGPAARTWLASYTTAYAAEKSKVSAAYVTAGRPPVVAQAFVTWACDLLGTRPVGTYGPQPPTASKVAELAGRKPGLVLDNSAMPGADALSPIKARRVTIVNFPGQSQDLLSVYRTNATALTSSLAAGRRG